MNKIVLATRKYKAGYEVRTELSRTNFEAVPIAGDVDREMQDVIDYICTPSDVIVKSAYTSDGHYIGNSKAAHFLIVKRGIKPELASPTHNVCSIGFCEKEQKWYGWSHRAIYGFSVGDVVKRGDCTASSGYTDEYLAEHPEDDTSLPIGFKAKDVIDVKRMAMAFAASVS
ncbi:MAG: hypothetical protein KKB38_20425 [Gammaproteobacteria bacterium]|nr:hypothetical protein [Gammaproteobacteria bacterium]